MSANASSSQSPAIQAEGPTKTAAPQVSGVKASSAASTSGVASAQHPHDKNRQDLEKAFSGEGLLIRTLARTKASDEFKHCDVTIEQAKALSAADKSAADRIDHSGLRKWSLAHADLKPRYYNMGPEATARPRGIAVLAMPSLVGEHVVGIHDKDNSSGGIRDDMKAMSPEKAKSEIGSMLVRMKSKDATEQGNENSEIQTVGIAPEAMTGLMFHPVMSDPKLSSWNAAQSTLKDVLKNAGPEFQGRTFPVFTFEPNGNGTKLNYLGDVSGS